jgi:hypothetical protein
VSTIEDLLERKSSGSGLENRDYGADHAIIGFTENLKLVNEGDYYSLADLRTLWIAAHIYLLQELTSGSYATEHAPSLDGN